MSLIAPAYAQAAESGAATMGGTLESFLPLILIFFVFYFLLIRPQQKKLKQQKEMLSAIRRGDRVVTGGGIIGLVTKVAGDQELVVEIADNVRVKVLRETVAMVLTRTEPVAANTNSGGGDAAAETGSGDDKGTAAKLKGLLSKGK